MPLKISKNERFGYIEYTQKKYFRKKLLATLGKHETRSLRLEEFLRLEKLFVDSLKIETATRNIPQKDRSSDRYS